MKPHSFVWLLVWAASEVSAMEVQGHRGARARVPENTIPAFQHALKAGVDVLELDLGVSRDGHVVVSHDLAISPTLCLAPGGKPIRGEPLLLSRLSLAEIQKYECGSLKQERFPLQTLVARTTIPTLDEVFAFVKKSAIRGAKTVRFNLETKLEPGRPNDTLGPDEFARKVLAVVRKHKMERRVVIQSFDFRTLREVKGLDSRLPVAALDERGLEDPVKALQAIPAEIYSPYWQLLDEAKMKKLKGAGLRVIPWTANDSSAWDRLLALGVDGIITDDPEALINYLREKGER